MMDGQSICKLISDPITKNYLSKRIRLRRNKYGCAQKQKKQRSKLHGQFTLNLCKGKVNIEYHLSLPPCKLTCPRFVYVVMTEIFRKTFPSYKSLGEKAMAQVADPRLFAEP